MKITFVGASETVTGSKHLLESGDHKILVDCGMYQGLKKDQRKNFEDLPFNPSDVDSLILTHGHLDHCGFIPKFVKEGFNGKIFCTEATADLMTHYLMLQLNQQKQISLLWNQLMVIGFMMKKIQKKR